MRQVRLTMSSSSMCPSSSSSPKASRLYSNQVIWPSLFSSISSKRSWTSSASSCWRQTARGLLGAEVGELLGGGLGAQDGLVVQVLVDLAVLQPRVLELLMVGPVVALGLLGRRGDPGQAHSSHRQQHRSGQHLSGARLWFSSLPQQNWTDGSTDLEPTASFYSTV